LSFSRTSPVIGPLFGLAILLAFEATQLPAGPQGAQADAVETSSQPANVGDAKMKALAYHDSGAYDRDLAAIAAKANHWLTARVNATSRPAVVFDIDETALSNWEVILLDDFGRPIKGPCLIGTGAPCGWAEWDQLGRDPAIEPTLDLFRDARAMGVAVFFITGRPESQRGATERNLADAGYSGYTKLYMVPEEAHFKSAADFKAPIRVGLERSGYTILVNMGDQPSDLAGGHAEKGFLLPNPFYRVP
jgi:predicted secreted acid phosphatase